MSRKDKRLGLGLILILLGALFLLGNLNFIPREIEHYIFSWQGIIIIVGSIIVATKQNKTPGWIMIMVGVFFLVPDILHIPGFRVRTYWPLILILLGVMFIMRKMNVELFVGKIEDDLFNKSDKDSDIDVLDDLSLFGGGDVVVSSDNFKGGRVTAVFGGSSYNFTSSTLSEGQAVIDVFAAFGGCTFIVPDDWNVRVEITSLFGGFSDKRSLSANTAVDPKKVLILKGLVLFGGGEVKSQ